MLSNQASKATFGCHIDRSFQQSLQVEDQCRMVQQASTFLHLDEEVDVTIPTSGSTRDRSKHPHLPRTMPRSNFENLRSLGLE